MSLDEKKHLDSDEIDLAQLFKIIWSYKYVLLLFIILSVPISVWVATSVKPTFKAETVFEKPINRNAQSNGPLLRNVQGLGFMSFLSGGIPGVMSSDSFFSEIRSESFLETVIINNANLDSQILRQFCPLPSKETSKFSLRSLLISLGISENKDPSESQKVSLLVKCVNSMLAIEFDNYGAGESSAYRLSIESGNPDFSAHLANEIVDKYFTRHKNKSDEDFQSVKKYLSNVITEAQLEFTEANKLMQTFIIKNALLMNIEPSFYDTNSDVVSLPLPPSPFAAKLGKDFSTLSQLENNLSQLKQAMLKLSSLKDLNQDEILKAISSTETQDALSRTFVASIAKIDNLPSGTSSRKQEIEKILTQEFQSIRRQIQVLEEKIGMREEQAMKLMSIENRFQELAIDVSKKKLIFEGLKDQLKEKILSTGLANIKQPVLLTKAVPPFTTASPNKKLIVALGVVLAIFVGIAFILIRQFFIRKVHSLSQLQNLSRFLNCYGIKYKQVIEIGRTDETVISQSFFSLTREMGKLGCIIDLSQKRLNNALASKFSKTIASVLATDSSKIVCLNATSNKDPLSGSRLQKNYSSDHSDFNKQNTLVKDISMFNKDDDIIGADEIKRIKNKYSEYDKIICALGAQIGDLAKFKFIEQCDFYILIGRSFHFDEYTYRKFSNSVWEKENKCLGFFLID